MAMHATTIRFTEDVWRLLEREAGEQGISSAQLIRDAAIMRVAFLLAERDDPSAALTLETLAERMAVRRRSHRVALTPPASAALADPARLARLHRTNLLDTEAEASFDRFARLAARVLNAPVSLVTLVDEDRQFFKSCLGLPEPWSSERQTPLSHSFCQYAVAQQEPFIVTDARLDERVRDNLAIRDLQVIAYAGVPLTTDDGHALGALCTIDHKPRVWTNEQIETLQDIAASVVSEIELRSRPPRG